MTYMYDPQLDDLEYYLHDVESSSKLSVLGGPALPALGHAISGATGSAISNILTYPLALSITRLQVQRSLKSSSSSSSSSSSDQDDGTKEPYKSIPDALRRIHAEEGGFTAFYSGCTQDTLKSMMDSFLFFLSYNFLRTNRLKLHSNGSPAKKLPVHEEILVGMASGAFSKFFTTPVAQIVTRKQTARMTGYSASGESSLAIARRIRQQKGLQGFWSGYSASLVLTLNPSLTMLFHETLLRVLVPRGKRENPGARITFLLAALSKAMASAITYPFSLAKSRAQVSSKRPLDDEESLHPEKESLKQTEQKAARKVRKDTIFDTVLAIAREEGVGGLYQGLSGEVLKGFFSHGLTMLMKESIHKIVIQLYYLVLKAIQRYPSPNELAEMAGEKLEDAREAVVEAAGEVVEAASDVVSGNGNGNGVKSAGKNGKEEYWTQQVGKTVDSLAEWYGKGKERTMDFLDDYIPEYDDDDNGWGW